MVYSDAIQTYECTFPCYGLGESSIMKNLSYKYYLYCNPTPPQSSIFHADFKFSVFQLELELQLENDDTQGRTCICPATGLIDSIFPRMHHLKAKKHNLWFTLDALLCQNAENIHVPYLSVKFNLCKKCCLIFYENLYPFLWLWNTCCYVYVVWVVWVKYQIASTPIKRHVTRVWLWSSTAHLSWNGKYLFSNVWGIQR